MPQDANVYADPVPPTPKKKKKGKKTGAIIAIILVVLLLIGGGVGYYFYSQHVYEENLAAYHAADALLDEGDYEGALEGFRSLGNFQDARARADELEELQEQYDEAKAMLAAFEFEDARDAFKALGNYRDSKEILKNEIPYQEACAAMNLAFNAVDSEAITMFEDTAASFRKLGEYKDSADLASECLLQAALLELDYENYDAAMAYKDQLTPAHAEQLDAAYAEACADGAFLQALTDAMILWYDENDKYTRTEEIELAWEMVASYENAHFEDPAMLDYLESFEYALQTMYDSMDSDGYVDVWSELYLGEYYLFELADTLYYEHGVFANDVNLQDQFVGVSDIYYAHHILESSFEDWWDYDASADQMSDGHYYATYYNDTGYSFNLYATIYFYGSNGNLLETSEEMTIYVAKGATVYIPCIPETISDSAWYTWGMLWEFGSIS